MITREATFLKVDPLAAPADRLLLAKLVFDQRFAETTRSVGARQSQDHANLVHFLACSGEGIGSVADYYPHLGTAKRS
jgi:hypothetical protein